MAIDGQKRVMSTNVRDRKQKSAVHIMNQTSMNNGAYCFGVILVMCCWMMVFSGCASSSKQELVLAVVDGERVTEEDLKYSLNIAHRREDLSSAGLLDLEEFIQRLIDERLIVHEARNAGVDRYPEVRQAVDAFLLRESVVRLHNQEIVQKVTVSEQEIMEHFRTNYERFTLELMELKSREEAQGILEKIRTGEKFRDLARGHSPHSMKDDDAEYTVTRNTVSGDIENALVSLNPGEISDIVKVNERYYIIHLLGKSSAPAEQYQDFRGRIERELRKQKEKIRSQEYLKELLEKSAVRIDREILSSIESEKTGEETGTRADDARTVAEVNGLVLTVADLVRMTPPSSDKSSEDIVNAWIDRKVVDQEALRRHYEADTGLQSAIIRYENEILKNTYIRKMIVPQITVREADLQQYYAEHQQDFAKPVRYRLLQITVKSREEAEEIAKSIADGADFSWLAKRKSIDSAASRGGDAGWIAGKDLPRPVAEVVKTMGTGETSPIIPLDSSYGIFRIQEMTENETEAYAHIKDTVSKAYIKEQIRNIQNKYLMQLRAAAEIRVYEENITKLKEKLRQ